MELIKAKRQPDRRAKRPQHPVFMLLIQKYRVNQLHKNYGSLSLQTFYRKFTESLHYFTLNDLYITAALLNRPIYEIVALMTNVHTVADAKTLSSEMQALYPLSNALVQSFSKSLPSSLPSSPVEPVKKPLSFNPDSDLLDMPDL